MDIAGVESLVSPRGWSLLAALPPYDESSSLALGSQLREAGYPADLVAAALTQSRLRARARDKLGDFADGMLFTVDGLEQATRLAIAARHAARFRDAGVRHVFDLGCGIGVDAMAFASLDLGVTAVDADPVTAAIAGVNLRHFDDVRAELGLAEDVDLSSLGPSDGVWLDPARRTPGRHDAAGRTKRVFNLDAISPSWSVVQDIAAQVPATGAKLSPSMPHTRVPVGAEAQWTSLRGEVLECAIWWGPLAHRPGRSAAVVAADGSTSVITQLDADTGTLGPVAAGAPPVGDHLYDPDRAVVRAGLVGALTAATDGVELANGAGYVVSPRAVDLPWARRYTVVEVLALNPKAIRAWARSAGVGRLTIKKRGVGLDVDDLRRRLRLETRSGREATVVLTRAGTRQVCLVVEPD